METSSAATAASFERFGRYEILHKLAAGGMGEVYLARAVGAAGFQKFMVIKKLLPHLVEQSQFVEGLIREAKLLVMLNHPNIVQVLDLGVEGTDYFMAMEYVHGYNLATIIHYCADQRHVIPYPACAAIAVEVLAGLDYAHTISGPDNLKRNIVHRDVSPQNVLISNGGQVKLTDFGIAKVVNESGGEFTQSLKGKFRYMAPEVLEGHRIDARYDLFAVGILLFESLCRRHLFSGSSDVTILNQVRQAKIPDITRHHPGIPPALVDVVHRSLVRDPRQRYQSAASFARELREAIKPLDISEALDQLRGFISDLYSRPDFPLNKPKLPDLMSGEQSLTRSIVIESQLTAIDKTPQGGQAGGRSAAILLLTSGLLLVAAAVIYLAYALLFKPPAPAPSNKPPVIIVTDRQDSAPAPLLADAVLPEPDAGRVSPRPTPRIVRRPFDKEEGKRRFQRRGAALMKCFNNHPPPGQEGLRVRVISTIHSNGRVAEVKLDPLQLASSPLGSCLVQVAAKIRYKPHDKESIDFIQPLVLKQAPRAGP